MKREQLRKILGEDASEDTIKAILDAAGADINSFRDRNDALQAKVDELTEANGKLTEAQQANMSEADKAAKALSDALAKAEKAKKRLSEVAAEREFAAGGLTEEEYKPFLAMFSGLDEEKSKETAQAISAAVKAHAEAAAEEAKKTALEGMQTPAGGQNGGVPTTREEFLKLPYAQQLELKQTSPDILNQLN